MLRHGKTSAHLDDCLILKGIDVCECSRCPTCGGLPNTYDHRPGSYPDEPGGLERMQMCDRYSSGKRWWRRMSDSDEAMEARSAI